MMSNGEQLYQAHKEWVQTVIGRADTQPSCLYGAVDSGKSTLLNYLATAQPFSDVHVIYWDLSPSVNLLQSGGEFWDAFARVLGDPELAAKVDVDDTVELEELVSLAIENAPGGNKPIVLILDHWDKALDDPQHVINDQALNILNHLLTARAEKPESDRRCRPVVVTNFPNTGAIVEWAHDRRYSSPGLYALSGALERRYTAANMPFISKPAAKKLLVDSGMTESLAAKVAIDSGGWLVAMNAALSLSDNREKRLDEVMPEINRAVTKALARRLFPHLRRSRPQKPGLSEIEWIGQTLAQYDRGEFRWSQLGLPTSDHAGKQLADCIRRVCEAQPFLFVDLENLTYWETLPEDRVAALENIASTLKLPDRNVYVIGRNAQRIKALLGEVPATWRQHWSALTQKQKKKKGESGAKDNSDDVVLASLVASTVERCPMATTYILSGDKDFWGALSPILHESSRVKQLFPGGDVPSVLKPSNSKWYGSTNVWTKALKDVGAKWKPKAQKEGTEVQTNVMP